MIKQDCQRILLESKYTSNMGISIFTLFCKSYVRCLRRYRRKNQKTKLICILLLFLQQQPHQRQHQHQIGSITPREPTSTKWNVITTMSVVSHSKASADHRRRATLIVIRSFRSKNVREPVSRDGYRMAKGGTEFDISLWNTIIFNGEACAGASKMTAVLLFTPTLIYISGFSARFYGLPIKEILLIHREIKLFFIEILSLNPTSWDLGKVTGNTDFHWMLFM